MDPLKLYLLYTNIYSTFFDTHHMQSWDHLRSTPKMLRKSLRSVSTGMDSRICFYDWKMLNCNGGLAQAFFWTTSPLLNSLINLNIHIFFRFFSILCQCLSDFSWYLYCFCFCSCQFRKEYQLIHEFWHQSRAGKQEGSELHKPLGSSAVEPVVGWPWTWIIKLPNLGGIKQYKSMVNLMGFPLNSALFELVSYNDPWWSIFENDRVTGCWTVRKDKPIHELLFQKAGERCIWKFLSKLSETEEATCCADFLGVVSCFCCDSFYSCQLYNFEVDTLGPCLFCWNF